MKINKYSLLFCVLLLSGLSTLAIKPCKAEINETDEVFATSKKIVVYIREYPGQLQREKPGFPPELQREAFKERIVSIIKKNFATCQPEGEVERSVIVVTSGIKDFYDPDNLGFYIQAFF